MVQVVEGAKRIKELGRALKWLQLENLSFPGWRTPVKNGKSTQGRRETTALEKPNAKDHVTTLESPPPEKGIGVSTYHGGSTVEQGTTHGGLSSRKIQAERIVYPPQDSTGVALLKRQQK